MKDQKRHIQGKFHQKYSSGIKSMKIHLANFEFNHKDSPEKGDIYVGRELLEGKLKSWLIGASKSGSYLVAGYRGMGKSSLVNRTLNQITRRKSPWVEGVYHLSVGCIVACVFALMLDKVLWSFVFGGVFLLGAACVISLRFKYSRNSDSKIASFPSSAIFSVAKVKKILGLQDRRERRYDRIAIKVNLGREVMNERDVLCLITNDIHARYKEFIRTGQNKPIWMYLRTGVCCVLASLLAGPFIKVLSDFISGRFVLAPKEESFLLVLWNRFFDLLAKLAAQHELLFRFMLTALIFWLAFLFVRFVLRKVLSRFDRSAECVERLYNLSDRLSSAVSEAEGNLPTLTNSLLNVSLFNRKHKESPVANVRDIEIELSDIINTINSGECFRPYQVQFYIVLDELDKIEQRAEKESDTSSEIAPPDFSTAIDGFSGSMTNSDRRKTILHLLANMKLFLTSARAKFIFISGRELYEAFLADLSDREYAISSIFSGVINVNSFLYPEREQSDISSMTEQYIAEVLLPKDYLWEQTLKNARDNYLLKREIPSLRWYAQYLTEQAKAAGEYNIETRLMEIRHVILFLNCFSVYLSHVSNGSPKKIVLYLEKYIKRDVESLKLMDWTDTLEYGTPKKYALCFSPEDQQKIGFIFHLAAPIMDVITSNVSNYDDKLLISASFIVDHLFKFHGRSFSWRNIEQTPELLDANKTPELRDFISSIMEFMQQMHLSSIMVGLFDFKFRKRISEEISYISRISDEAAAIFNFTLNESQAVKQHNIKLLNYYMEMNRATATADQSVYNDAISRIHFSLGDLYFQEEDYSRAIQEYRNAVGFLDKNIKPGIPEKASSLIVRIRCLLRIGLTYEYRKTYDTAYIVYCQLVDTMISVREVHERKLGMDQIDTWTGDWRVKQPMIVDFGVRRRDDQTRRDLHQMDQDRYDLYRGQFVNGIWDDGAKVQDINRQSCYAPAEYSLDFDRVVSGFAKNLSPEKSRFVVNLSMFEDVRLVYKAILAKLFVLEKMNMSGITQSNIDIAEAEFKYLHRTINLKEKFFISADFFNQLGKILFYKNSLGLLPGNTKPDKEPLHVAMYWWNVDFYAYLDDYCFLVCNPHVADRKDAIVVKRHIREFFDRYVMDWKPFEDARAVAKTIQNQEKNEWQIFRRKRQKQLFIEAIKNGQVKIESAENSDKVQVCDETLHKYVMVGKPLTARKCMEKSVRKTDKELFIETIQKKLSEPNPSNGDQAQAETLLGYVEYVADRLDWNVVSLEKIQRCSEHRCEMRENGWNLPCYACKYYNQSLRILIDEMFIDVQDDQARTQYQSGSKALFLLRYSFRKELRYTRVNHLRLLAMNIVSMGNTLLSCAADKKLSAGALKFVRRMLRSDVGESKETYVRRVEEKTSSMSMGKLDKALLYYLAAYRYYNIAKQPKDAGDCLFKILKLINEMVTGFNFDKKSKNKKGNLVIFPVEKEELGKSLDVLFGEDNLLEAIFVRYAKTVSMQHGYSAIPELYDYKWLFHMNDIEDLSLERLHTYSELKEAIWLISDTRIKLLNIRSHYHRVNDPLVGERESWTTVKSLLRDEVVRTYNHFNPVCRIGDTFYNEIVTYYAKFRLNKLIIKDMFGKDPLVEQGDSHSYDRKFVWNFADCLERYLSRAVSSSRLDARIFHVEDTLSDKLQLVEFILEDSIVSLTEILYILTPYNHISSFSNSFVAEVYAQLWEHSKMYETLILIYNYQQHHGSIDIDRAFEMRKYAAPEDFDDLKRKIKTCCEYIIDDVDLESRYGMLSQRFFMRVRHQIDDRTIHHVFSNYAAEMALHYYSLAESSHAEGDAYKHQIDRNYILNDDLENDTWLFNTSLERYRLHTGYIRDHRLRLVEMYTDSRFYKLRSYIDDRPLETEFAQIFDPVRFDDSLYTNSEL